MSIALFVWELFNFSPVTHLHAKGTVVKTAKMAFLASERGFLLISPEPEVLETCGLKR